MHADGNPAGREDRSLCPLAGAPKRNGKMHNAFVAFIVQAGGELGLRDIVADIPHDAPAIFVYVLIGVSLALIAFGSWPRKGGPSEGK